MSHTTLLSRFTAGVVHWQHPSFFAYFGANVSAPAMLADMWSSAINMIGFSWAAAPVSTELEMVGVRWAGTACLVALGVGGEITQHGACDAVPHIPTRPEMLP